MSVVSRVFRGFGNGTVIGTIVGRVFRGFVSGDPPAVIPSVRINRKETLTFSHEDRTMIIPSEDRGLIL